MYLIFFKLILIHCYLLCEQCFNIMNALNYVFMVIQQINLGISQRNGVAIGTLLPGGKNILAPPLARNTKL